MNWEHKYEKRRKGCRILVLVKHSKIFHAFMGIDPEGGRCRQVQKKTRFVINNFFTSTTLKITLKRISCRVRMGGEEKKGK
jgi:hypothetical protein